MVMAPIKKTCPDCGGRFRFKHSCDRLPTFDQWRAEKYGDPKGQVLDKVLNRLGEYITEMVRRSVG